MFEKAKPFLAPLGAAAEGARVASRPARRAGEALRAVEWSELTARLNAARDLRLLLRTESQAPIEPAAASFGDAAASYFALLDGNSEQAGNLDALGQSKGLNGMIGTSKTTRADAATGEPAGASRSDARDT